MRFRALRTILVAAAKKSSPSRRGHRRFRPTFDLLEDRRMLTTWWVGSVNANFADIQGAVSSSSVHNGDTIKVEPGTYVESVTVAKSLTILGGQRRDPTEVPGPSIVESNASAFTLSANGVSIDNFTFGPDAPISAPAG